MEQLAQLFIAAARDYLTGQYLPKIESCVARMTDEDLRWRAGDESNSISNLILHLTGSTRTWIVGVAGGVKVDRDRAQEFVAQATERAELLAGLRAAVAEADAVLARLKPEELLAIRQSPWEDMNVMAAIFHAVEHFAMHTGQIILIAKQCAATDLQLSD